MSWIWRTELLKQQLIALLTVKRWNRIKTAIQTLDDIDYLEQKLGPADYRICKGIYRPEDIAHTGYSNCHSYKRQHRQDVSRRTYCAVASHDKPVIDLHYRHIIRHGSPPVRSLETKGQVDSNVTRCEGHSKTGRWTQDKFACHGEKWYG